MWAPELLAADESAGVEEVGAASSSDLMRLASGCSAPSWSPFCRLVGRRAEAEAWVASRWRGLATTVAEREETEEEKQVSRGNTRLTELLALWLTNGADNKAS